MKKWTPKISGVTINPGSQILDRLKGPFNTKQPINQLHTHNAGRVDPDRAD